GPRCFEGACASLLRPGADGSFGVHAPHSNMISAGAPGELHYRPAEGPDAGREKIAAVSAGLIKVERNDVLVLVDTAERPEEIDDNRASRAADKAIAALLLNRIIHELLNALYNLAHVLCLSRAHTHF